MIKRNNQNTMTTNTVCIVFCLLCIGSCAIHLVDCGVAVENENLWYATPYPKGEVCIRKENTFDTPGLQQFATGSSCFQQLKKLQSAPKHSLRTVEAAKTRKLNLITYNNVTTRDGYILKVFRITGYENEQPVSGKPAVMLVHPVTSSSDVWFFVPGKRSLVNKLVAAGYEVWLPNIRGTSYSQGHLTLNANSKLDRTYWNFGMHEVGVYDLPAIIDLMLKETGTQKIFYIGHSVSTNYDAIARAEIPEMNDKFHASFWMASTLFLGHMRGFWGLASDLLLGHGKRSEFMVDVINKVTRGRVELQHANPSLRGFELCASTPYLCKLCRKLASILGGIDASQAGYIEAASGLLLGDGVSLKMMTHSAENARVCRFQKFNYGPRKNYKLYGQLYPPLYNLSNVRSPVYMYYGDKDLLATPADQEITRKALPPGTVKGFFHQNLKDFNHISFIYANNVDVLVYDSIVKIIESYTNMNA